MPVYQVLKDECVKAPSSTTRHYDDLNEMFWRSQCMQLKFPPGADEVGTGIRVRFRSGVSVGVGDRVSLRGSLHHQAL